MDLSAEKPTEKGHDTPDSTFNRFSRGSREIMTTWARRVRAEIPAAREQTAIALEDAIPLILHRLAEALRKTESPVKLITDAKASSEKHGLDRAQFSTYSLHQVVEEYRILQETIFDYLEKGGTPLSIRDRETILNFISLGVADAVTSYSNYEKSQIQNYIDKLEEEKSNRELFVSMLSHDMRTPLTTAILIADHLIHNPELAADLTPNLARSLERTDRMVTDLLDANRIRTGERLDLEKAECDLRSICAQVIADLATQSGERFVLNSPTQVIGYWNAEALRRALTNLCTNAIKFGDPNAPITITLTEMEIEVSLSVNNKGRTLSREELSHIFLPFRRGSAGSASPIRGWGLGLTIVKGIVDAHYGRMTVVSDENIGTTFEITLPKDIRTVSQLPRP